MARKAAYVQVGKRKLELSNLDKVLYPDVGFIKAQVIEYYLKIAPTVLKYLRGRPLSLVRFPDGIHGETFFQKNRPEWAPDWISYVKLEKIEYMLATEDASLVFLANLACLEFHQMQIRPEVSQFPDYIVFDLDPPEGMELSNAIEIAFELKPFLEDLGYHPFVKTTGGKGIHVIVPIEQKWTYDEIFEAAKDAAQPFMEKHSSVTTLHIKKENRKGRILIDIYRNRPGQTIISAYSLRGKPGGPVSMPVTWEELENTSSSLDFNLLNAPDLVQERDPWEGIGAYSTAIHTKRSKVVSLAKKTKSKSKEVESENSGGSDAASAIGEEPPEDLKEYKRKRIFTKTPEPPAGSLPQEDGMAFVIHRHHASRLHYDLRLEQDGVLQSWAVPKGLPPRPGIKRLAVMVEQHPLKYTHFEGIIPKGQYGAGRMWIYARGKYEVLKEKKDGFYMRLNSKEITAEYRMIHTKDKDWLVERLDSPQIDFFSHGVEPMLASSASVPPESEDFTYELKWDGIRAMIYVDEGQIKILSRNGKDITKQFPELADAELFRATSAVFDGEIVCLDSSGKPIFQNVIRRLQQTAESGIERLKKKLPVVCYVFDCLCLDGRSIMNDPLYLRKEWMEDALKQGTAYRPSLGMDDGNAFFDAAKQMGLEGIIAKDKKSPYLPGKRSKQWIKVKARQTADCIVLGYVKGKGDREKLFGSLQVARIEKDDVIYSGRAGSGFDDRAMAELLSIMEKRKTDSIDSSVQSAGKVLGADETIWIEPMRCEIQYASITPDGMFREPVFLRLRQDLD